MAKWINHVAISRPRQAGVNTNTVNPASTTTVVDGAAFTPTAGNLLVCVVEGAVTSTTPSGWTLPTGGSAISNTGLYVWYRTAAGSDSISTTHNGSNYPVIFHFFEFASGSTFVKSAAATGVALSDAQPTLSGLTGTNLIMAAAGGNMANGTGTISAGWGSGAVEETDTSVAFIPGSTDGYFYTLGYLEDSVLTSVAVSLTVTSSGGVGNLERLTWAVNVAAGGGGAPATPPLLIMQTRRSY